MKIYKAQPVPGYTVPDLNLVATETLPSNPDDPSACSGHYQGVHIVEALRRSLPGRTVDGVLRELLLRKASELVVPAPSPEPCPHETTRHIASENVRVCLDCKVDVATGLPYARRSRSGDADIPKSDLERLARDFINNNENGPEWCSPGGARRLLTRLLADVDQNAEKRGRVLAEMQAQRAPEAWACVHGVEMPHASKLCPHCVRFVWEDQRSSDPLHLRVEDRTAHARGILRGWGCDALYGPCACGEDHNDELRTEPATPESVHGFGGVDPRSAEGHLRSVLWELLGGQGAESVESAAQRVVRDLRVARAELEQVREEARRCSADEKVDRLKVRPELADLGEKKSAAQDEEPWFSVTTPASMPSLIDMHRGWKRAWEVVAKEHGSTECQCDCCGEIWQYMGSTVEGHGFRHRDLNGKGRASVLVPLDRDDYMPANEPATLADVYKRTLEDIANTPGCPPGLYALVADALGWCREHTVVTEGAPPSLPSKILTILGEVGAEFVRASADHEPHHSAHESFAVLDEERDELWDEVKKRRSPERTKRIREEAIQVAACAVRLVHDICDREVRS